MRWTRAVGVILAGLVAVTSCGGDDDSAAPTTTTTAPDDETTVTTGVPIGDDEWDAVVLAALDDMEVYWDETFPALYGAPFEPISGGYWPYRSDTEQPPCGDPPPAYSDIAENAFYCSTADLVAWDDENLVPGLYEQFGAFTLGIVFAHEFGHAVQARAGVEGPTIQQEQQADCFAGAWTSWVADGNSPNFNVSLADLDNAIAGFLQLRDTPGTVETDPQAHGSAFDRVGAFQEGFIDGPEQCVTYADGNYTVIELPFNDQQDYESGGNLPYEDVEELTVLDLEDFWSIVLPAQYGVAWTPISNFAPYDPAGEVPPCGSETYAPEAYAETAFYCVPEDYIGWDEANLMPSLYDEIGDFAMAVIIGNQYSLAAEVRVGNLDTSVDAYLQADCYTGTWVASSVLQDRPNAQFVLSPGDLDEAVTAFLAFGDPPEEIEAGTGTFGTAFQRVVAFRDGFINGITECDSYLDG